MSVDVCYPESEKHKYELKTMLEQCLQVKILNDDVIRVLKENLEQME